MLRLSIALCLLSPPAFADALADAARFCYDRAKTQNRGTHVQVIYPGDLQIICMNVAREFHWRSHPELQPKVNGVPILSIFTEKELTDLVKPK